MATSFLMVVTAANGDTAIASALKMRTRAMEHLREVESAKALMTEAVSWSVMKWLREKKRVRKTADDANAVLDQLSQSLKQSWPDNFKIAYESLTNGKTSHTNALEKVDPGALLIARKIKKAEDEAYRVRMDAEATFDQAEKKLSTALAREGCRKAIQSWELKEQAIRKAKSVYSTD